MSLLGKACIGFFAVFAAGFLLDSLLGFLLDFMRLILTAGRRKRRRQKQKQV